MPTTLDLEPPPSPAPLPRGIDLPTEDGQNVESAWHLKAMWLLIASVEQHLLGRDDFVVNGNQFFYFDPAQAKNNNFRGPDFYFVRGVPREPIRRSWVVWDEGGRVPNVVIELLSPSTADEDRGPKKKVYLQDLAVKEYFCYDPDGHVLEGWRKNGRQKPTAIAPQDGRLWSEELGLFLGRWDGEHLRFHDTWPRFFDAKGNLVLIAEEAAAQQAAEAAARAQAAAARAQAATALAQAEKQAKDAALAEVARLKAELERLTTPPAP